MVKASAFYSRSAVLAEEIEMALTRPTTTADDLLVMDLLPGRYDLIDGELIRMPPAGEAHGVRSYRIIRRLGPHVEAGDLGQVYPPETGFVLPGDPEPVVSPDVAFVRKHRLDPNRDQEGYLRVAPDFAVEIVSPSDYPLIVERKIAKYLAANVPLLWVVYPESRTVRVLGAGREPAEFGEGDVLDGGEVLPDFRLAVADIFA
jgi:Uma2 family endonuclease